MEALSYGVKIQSELPHPLNFKYNSLNTFSFFKQLELSQDFCHTNKVKVTYFFPSSSFSSFSSSLLKNNKIIVV